jgi:hypothetical protein
VAAFLSNVYLYYEAMASAWLEVLSASLVLSVLTTFAACVTAASKTYLLESGVAALSSSF